MKNVKKLFILLVAILLSVSLCACENNTSTTSSDITSTEEGRYKANYNFTYFKNDNKSSVEEITDGVLLVKNEITKINGDKVIVYALEIDLNKVSIEAGTYNNESYNFSRTKETPYNMAMAYENQTGNKVYASINADFFGNQTVNAFVKNGYIIKNAHTTNAVFDYLDTNADLPASAPMLFGVKGSIPQVAPIRSYTGDITTSDVKRKVATSTLTYNFTFNETTISSSGSFKFTTDAVTLDNGAVYSVVDLSSGTSALKVEETIVLNKRTSLDAPGKGKGYIYSLSNNSKEFNFVNSLKKDDVLSMEVKSATSTWNGYDTIIGCRHALIIDGEIPFTVALEYSNGCKREDVPKCSVGIKNDNTVVLFTVESLYYGGKAQDGDTHGVSLSELAEFMHYYNIYQGANFDGGGSVQLIVRENDVFNKVVVRSSDTGSYDADKSRKVMNALLVVEKGE